MFKIKERILSEDTISRKSILDKVTNLRDHALSSNDQVFSLACETLINLIKQEPPSQAWILVTDKLPKANTRVLVTTQLGVSDAYYDGKNFRSRTAGQNCVILKTVKAWQYVPNKYTKV